MPVLLGLALGAAAAIRVADARGGLDAACSAAVAAAARAADQPTAAADSMVAFQAVASQYPVLIAGVSVDSGSFQRGGPATCDATATVDLSFVPLPGSLSVVTLRSHAGSRIDAWRSRR